MGRPAELSAIAPRSYALSKQISSANYEARACGVRASMSISAAKALCPELVVMPYQFERYQQVCGCVGAGRAWLLP